MLLSSLAAVVAVLGSAVQVEAGRTFIIGEANALVMSRMDPIRAPGAASGHLHRVIGGSGFTSMLLQPDDLLKSECTTVRQDADKSNYWTPAVYFIEKDGSYTLLPHSMKIYYFMHNDEAKYTAFPPGMRMISGLAMNRDPGAIQVQGIDVNINPYHGNPEAGKIYNNRYFPNGTMHPEPPLMDYFHVNVRFPSCGWANQSLDSDDHFSHMTWPVVGDSWAPATGSCPESHPIHYPEIFMENFVYVSDRMKAEWKTDKPNIIFSNGDVTGVTAHADFVAGWEHDVLQAALDTCGDFGADMGNCAPFAARMDPDNSGFGSSCRTESMIPVEDVGLMGSIEHLPGCNPQWEWDGPAEKPKDCPWYTEEPGWAHPNLMWSDYRFQYPVAVAGLNATEAMEKEYEGGLYGPGKLVSFGLDKDLKNNLTYVTVGTQEEVDAAAASPAAHQPTGTPFTSTQVEDKYKIPAATLEFEQTHAVADSPWTYSCRHVEGAEPLQPLPCDHGENHQRPGSTPAAADGAADAESATATTPEPSMTPIIDGVLLVEEPSFTVVQDAQPTMTPIADSDEVEVDAPAGSADKPTDKNCDAKAKAHKRRSRRAHATL